MAVEEGVCWQAFICLGAVTFAATNFLTRWLLPGGRGRTCVGAPSANGNLPNRGSRHKQKKSFFLLDILQKLFFLNYL